MKRKDVRDEIIRAFRKYARLGLYDKSRNPIQTYRRIELICSSRRSKLDMLAVFDTLRILELTGEDEALHCIRTVYFSDPALRLGRLEMGRLVTKCSFELYCDERTVYRKLQNARDLFEQVREKVGLIDD